MGAEKFSAPKPVYRSIGANSNIRLDKAGYLILNWWCNVKKEYETRYIEVSEQLLNAYNEGKLKWEAVQ